MSAFPWTVAPPFTVRSAVFVTPSGATVKLFMVIDPIDKSPDPSTVVAPEIAPALVMPPLELFNDLEVTFPSPSTPKPIIVIVPMVKSPDPSTVVAPEIAPADIEAKPSVSVVAVAVVNVPAAAALAPITDPSIEELSMSPPFTVKLSATIVSVTSPASTTWLLKSV